MSALSRRRLVMPAWITRVVPGVRRRQLWNKTGPAPNRRRPRRCALPEIRQRHRRPCRGFDSSWRSVRKTSRNHGGIAVAAMSRDVLDLPPFSFDSVVVGASPRMRTVFDFVRVIADSESNVLIVGETGTGKETIATLIHQSSARRRRPFVPVSCAILTETLIESELFGHERGAFTGALRDHAGRFEMAQGGTIFLDDIDDVPRSVQVKLLRVLQNRTVERVGGTRAIPIDVRVITGSKRSLQRLAEEGRFREDLYYRLNVVPIWLPPLRERREDIVPLTDHFLRRFFTARGMTVPALSPVVRAAFERHDWPGNVRELENACERIAQTCTCSTIRVGCMPASLLFQQGSAVSAPAPVAAGAAVAPTSPGRISLDARLQEVETHLIEWALRTSHGNKSRAAELLRIKRSTLGDRIRRL